MCLWNYSGFENLIISKFNKEVSLMISPDFRATEVPNLLQGFQYYISSNHGKTIDLLIKL